MPAYEWVREQLALEQNPELKRQVHVDDGDVECRRMIDGIDLRGRSIDLVEARNCDGGENRLHNEPGPESGKAVMNPAIAVEERTEQGERAEGQRVGPDERINYEIRAQA